MAPAGRRRYQTLTRKFRWAICNDTRAFFACNAVTGEWAKNGTNTVQRRRSGHATETPVRNIEGFKILQGKMVRHTGATSPAGCSSGRERVGHHRFTCQYENGHPLAEVRPTGPCDPDYGNTHTFPSCVHANCAPKGILRGCSAGYFRRPIPSTIVINNMHASTCPRSNWENIFP